MSMICQEMIELSNKLSLLIRSSLKERDRIQRFEEKKLSKINEDEEFDYELYSIPDPFR